LGRARNLDAKCWAYDERRGSGYFSPQKPVSLRYAFPWLNAARRDGTEITFVGVGPDAERYLQIIAEECELPNDAATTGKWGLFLMGMADPPEEGERRPRSRTRPSRVYRQDKLREMEANKRKVLKAFGMLGAYDDRMQAEYRDRQGGA
jgi:hypothetical protein